MHPAQTIWAWASQFRQSGKHPPKCRSLRSFLGLVNYYRRFIKGYSAKAAPLTDLLKKSKPWDWSKDCQATFEELKAAISKEPLPGPIGEFRAHDPH
ncbi:hypothetical protein Patl1_32272 [Pistacia atlantica]|uniref:Uncharacterized protein n=1 Tax=Pistacia atlantica TaxID=434234 RepID=A0ACC1ARC1_9ROSI|nr:hypothetical protein Patl1_32272 [Pistacia atlantica]